MESAEQILSKEQCEIILRKHFENEYFELIDYKIVPLSDNVEGFLGDHKFVKTEVECSDGRRNPSFFMKIPPFEQELMLEFAKTSSALEKEIFFYEVLLHEFIKYCPTFNKNIVPKFYFAKENNTVVMENLQEKKYSVAPFSDLMDIKHIKLALKTLAQLHSAGIIYEEKKSSELGRPYRLIDVYEEYLGEPFFRKDENYLGYKWHVSSRECIKAIIDKMPEMEITKDDFKQKFHELAERSFEIILPSKRFRNVCTHGDLWRKNVMFRYENGVPLDCKLIDTQFLKYNPPAFDVLKFIFQSTNSLMRQHHFEDLLEYYYDNLYKQLTIGGIDAYVVLSRDEFYAGVRYMLPQCKVETSYYYSFQKTGLDFLKKLMENNEAFKEYAFGNRIPHVLLEYNDKSDYKKWMDEILLDIKDMVINYGITREDCHSIIQKKLHTTDYNLIKYNAVLIEEKAGFLGDHIKLKIYINIKDKEVVHSFFAKILPQSAFNSFIIKSGAFENERFMFDHVFPKVSPNIYVPKCYYSRSNDILGFEDLNELGYYSLDKYKALDYDQVCVIVKSLAQFHSSILGLEEKLTKQNGKEFRVAKEYKNNLLDINYSKEENHIGLKVIRSAVKGVFKCIELFPDLESTITDKEFMNIIENIYKNVIYDLASPSEKYRNVICHGDLWANNIMIKYDSDKPVDCKLVDFQVVRLCPPAQDLMMFLHVTTTRKFRVNFLSNIITLYYAELKQCLKDLDNNIENIITQEEFIQSCEEYKTFAIIQEAFYFPIIMLSPESMEKFFADKELCRHVMFDDRSEFIEKMCKEDERYKTFLGESIKDLRLMCENLHVV